MMAQAHRGSCKSSVSACERDGRMHHKIYCLLCLGADTYHYGWERIRSNSNLEQAHSSTLKGAEAWALVWRKG